MADLKKNAFPLGGARHLDKLNQTLIKWNLGLLLWYWNQTAVLSVEKPVISHPNEER